MCVLIGMQEDDAIRVTVGIMHQPNTTKTVIASFECIVDS